eukprot:jgi/Picre1/31252/NNA_006606.t1
MTYPHNILPVECRCTKQDDSDSFSLESVDKLEDFERIPAKHFAVMMQNIMEVLHLDEEAINNFCQKVNQKIKDHNALVHPSPIKTQEHTNSCYSHWQPDACDLLTAHATSHSQCMKAAVWDGLDRNIHTATSVRIPVYLGPAHVQGSSGNVHSHYPESSTKRACLSTSPGKPVRKKSCCTQSFFSPDL